MYASEFARTAQVGEAGIAAEMKAAGAVYEERESWSDKNRT